MGASNDGDLEDDDDEEPARDGILPLEGINLGRSGSSDDPPLEAGVNRSKVVSDSEGSTMTGGLLALTLFRVRNCLETLVVSSLLSSAGSMIEDVASD